MKEIIRKPETFFFFYFDKFYFVFKQVHIKKLKLTSKQK